MFGAVINGWNWAAVAAFAVSLLALAAWEAKGVIDHDAHLVDTISELYWKMRDATGPFKAVLSVALAGFFVWLWWHFTYQGKQRAATRLSKEAETRDAMDIANDYNEP